MTLWKAHLEGAHACDAFPLGLNCGCMLLGKIWQRHEWRQDKEADGQMYHCQEDRESAHINNSQDLWTLDICLQTGMHLH